jgi:hypothetical protein
MRKEGEEEDSTQDPLSSSPATCTSPTIVTAPAPTHSMPQPRPKPPSTRARSLCPVLLDAQPQGPQAGELLDTLSPNAQAYINPHRSNEETHTTPGYRPDTISSSLSLWFIDACITGEVLDAEGAAAFDLPGASRRWELVEEHRRSRFRPSPSSSTSSTHAAVAVVVFTARR